MSHVILDMLQFFDMDNEMGPSGEDGVFGERVQHMFRAPSIVACHKNPYADGGGPKLQSTTFAPTAEFFRTLRTSQASLDLQEKHAVSVEDNGLEGSLTATRRQNFLVPRAVTAPSRRLN